MGKTTAPILNTLEVLLQGGPHEFMEVTTSKQPESDRAAMTRCARVWAGSTALQPEERERIRLVWLEGRHRPPLNVPRARRDELRALILPRSRRESRPDTEQLQAALQGEPGGIDR